MGSFLLQSDSETLTHAFVTNRIDYCNTLFTGLPLTAINFIQDAAARILTGRLTTAPLATCSLQDWLWDSAPGLQSTEWSADFSDHSRTVGSSKWSVQSNTGDRAFSVYTPNLLNWGLHQRYLLLNISWRHFELLISFVFMYAGHYFPLFYYSAKHSESFFYDTVLYQYSWTY